MPGPAPKNPSTRQRRNKSASSALLPAETKPIVSAPKLPAPPDGEKWLPLVKQFWADVWTSPMSAQYLEADVHGLFRAAILLQEFYKNPTVQLSAELRQLGMNYGLSPIDRRRLQWTVARAEEAEHQTEKKRSGKARIIENDPREVLAK